MKILSITDNSDKITVQSVNGLLFIEEDWMKKARSTKQSNSNKQKKK
ncbi:hypothetical protein [Marinifilum caeruleilacunae]|nr:hypothetical protein [Marinifilum caeruleilacunae]